MKKDSLDFDLMVSVFLFALFLQSFRILSAFPKQEYFYFDQIVFPKP